MNKLQVIQNMLDEQTRRLHHQIKELAEIEDELGEATYLLQQIIIEQEHQDKQEQGYDHVQCE